MKNADFGKRFSEYQYAPVGELFNEGKETS